MRCYVPLVYYYRVYSDNEEVSDEVDGFFAHSASMSEQITNKFVELHVRSDREVEDVCAAECCRVNSEDELIKTNPWKPVSATENNALEAEAWPEPSAPGEQRRTVGFRQFEEKPKRKIKWQNFDVDHSPCGFSRGRGRPSAPSHFYGSAPVYTFRRGGTSFRGRLPLDTTRGRGSGAYLPRHPSRAPAVRPPMEPGEGPSEKPIAGASSDQNYVRHKSEATSQEDSVTRSFAEADEKPPDYRRMSTNGLSVMPGCISVTAMADTTQSEYSSEPQVTRPVTASQNTITSKRSYRDRTFTAAPAQQGQSFNGSTATYEAGPAGRARRSYLRQHQPLFSAEQGPTSTQQSPISSHNVQPLLPFQPLVPFTYIIPGTSAVSNSFWGTGIQLGPSFGSTTLGVPGNLTAVLGVNQSHLASQSNSMTIVPNIPTELPVGLVTELNPLPQPIQPIQRVPPHASPFDPYLKNSLSNSDVHVEVVFPSSLKEHPTIASAIRTAFAAEPDAVCPSDEGAATQINGGDSTSNRSIKPDDVVIVDNCVFFVPRNASRTKFLKFVSKSDYIRHHVEYYFSPLNLNRDTHLASILKSNQGLCPIGDLLQFNRLRWVGTSESELLTAISTSSLLSVTYSSDGRPTAIRHMSTFATEDASFQSEITLSQRSENVHLSSNITQNGTEKNDAAALSTDSSQPTSRGHSISDELGSTSGSSATRSGFTYSVVPASNHLQLVHAPGNFPAGGMPFCGQNAINPAVQCYQRNEVPGLSNPSFSPPTAFIQDTLSSQQATLLSVAAATASPPVQPGLSASGLHSPDASSTLAPALYRIAPAGHLPYIPQIAGNTGFSLAPNSTVLFQFLPATHAMQHGGYIIPAGGANATPVLNRPAGSINPTGLWIPLVTGGTQPATSVSSPQNTLLTLPPGPVGLPTVSSSGGSMVLHSVAPPPPTTNLVAFPNVEPIYSGHPDQKSPDISQSHIQHILPNFYYSTNASVGLNHPNLPIVNELKPNPVHSQVTKLPGNQTSLPFSTEAVTTTGSHTRTSTHSTPNKLPIALRL
ncbi:la domain protein [Opisthorchis viverrini]|uniref:La domain protein n=1 Tax=Opisthorchis viverrini TaxID=6198 RepID=A0A1S8X4F4_OPIVI|nr:la domain protein [Opisthorchis viverrini]